MTHLRFLSVDSPAVRACGRRALVLALAIAFVVGACIPGTSATPSLYLLRRTTPGSAILGASAASRGETYLVRLSADGRRLEVTSDPGVGAAALPDGSLVRVRQNTRTGARSRFERIDAASLRPLNTIAELPYAAYEVVSEGNLLFVASAAVVRALRVPSGETAAQAALLEDPGRESCNLPPILLPLGARRVAIAGACRSAVPTATFSIFIWSVDDGILARYASPALEYDAPYAVGTTGDQLFVAAPTRRKLWALSSRDGSVLWETQLEPPPEPKYPAKRVGAANAILVAPDGRTLYVTLGGAVEGDVLRPTTRGVWVVDAETGTVRDRLLSEVTLTGLALTPAGKLVLTSPQDGGSLLLVDPRTGVAEIRLRGLGSEVVGILAPRSAPP